LKTLFVSDLHLDEARPEGLVAFDRFLDGPATQAEALYILGDLFESWVGDDGISLPLPSRVAGSLTAAATRMPVHFMHGNRDFLIAERFSRETGVKLLPDPTVIDLYGRRTALMHGDTLCTDDLAYQAFRRQVRDPRWQQAALAKPMAERLAIAEAMRKQSEGAKQGKEMAIMDVAPAAVEQAFRDTGCDVLIHGHTHRPGKHALLVDGRARTRWVLPDWYGRGGYLEATPPGFTAVAL
jgi:UDP-2,3-diacylglucosamine hydrolase